MKWFQSKWNAAYEFLSQRTIIIVLVSFSVILYSLYGQTREQMREQMRENKTKYIKA